MSDATLSKLAEYLVKNGFAGNIPINEGAKNWHSIKRLIRQEPFYTFGINGITTSVKTKKINADLVREILIDASGLDLARFRRKNGYFDPTKSAAALVKAVDQVEKAAKSGQRLAFGTGHPGSMTGLLYEMAIWAQGLGGQIVQLDQPVVIKEPFYLDAVGPVLVPSDNCSIVHSHDSAYMEAFIREVTPDIDLLVGDHGFVGAAINHGIPSVGFYDTDDPAMPLAAYLGLPVLAVPLNDNRYNTISAALARFVIGTDR